VKVEEARVIMEAARAKAQEMGKSFSVSIVDAGGILVLFERINNSPAMTAVFSEGKAVTSATLGVDGINLLPIREGFPHLINSMTQRLRERFLPSHGGIVIRDASGTIIGGIGISGGLPDEDEQCARAAVAAFSK
jgi:uncharacterized protein GlcG (DUF336 family)